LNQELDEKKNEPIKYKEEEENIIIHDYDSF
jgi:hypothetical protein